MAFDKIPARFALSLSLAAVLCVPVGAQDSTAAAAAERSVTTGVFSQKQAERGEGSYKTVCQACHAKTEYTGDKFKTQWVSKTAYDVFNQIRTTMPDDNPGSLERQEYVDLVAYIFSLNAYPAGEADLPSDDEGLKKVRIDAPPSSFASSASARPAAHPRVTFRK
jgi:cbb3-type cytochrome c oxidase subunit III